MTRYELDQKGKKKMTPADRCVEHHLLQQLSILSSIRCKTSAVLTNMLHKLHVRTFLLCKALTLNGTYKAYSVWLAA